MLSSTCVQFQGSQKKNTYAAHQMQCYNVLDHTV